MNIQRHPLDIGSLVFGLIFLGIVVVWELSYLGYVSGDDASWVVPILLVGAGALGVVLAATKERRAEARERSEWAQESATNNPERRAEARERSEWAQESATNNPERRAEAPEHGTREDDTSTTTIDPLEHRDD